MGWNTAGLLVEGASFESVVQALPGPVRATGDEVDGYDALSRSWQGPYGIGQVGSWTVVADPGVKAALSPEVGEALSRGGRVCAFVVQSTAWVYGFAWYEAARLVRRVIYVNGELAEEGGAPVPQEQDLPEPWSEDYVPEVIERLTGLGWSALEEARFKVAAPR